MKITLLDKQATTQKLATYSPLPLFISSVPAGFPSPADDYIEDGLDLNQHLIKHPAATYLARASGDSMIKRGILDKALLVVDRSIQARQGHIVIAAINGELSCKVLDINNQQLISGNAAYPPIPLNEDMDFLVEGVVIHAINDLCTPS